MAKYAQIEDLETGEVFRVVEETDGEVYFYDEDHRWCYWDKSNENFQYQYVPAGTRLVHKIEIRPCGTRHSKFVWCRDCVDKEKIS